MQGRVSFFNQRGERLLEELWRQRDIGEAFWSIGGKQKSISALKLDGRDIRPTSGNACQLTVRFESNPNEKLYGMGQYQQPHLDLKGCTLELAQRNSQASVPFALSSSATDFSGTTRRSAKPSLRRTKHGGKPDRPARWTIGSRRPIRPAEMVAAYANATGKPPMMPEYALGSLAMQAALPYPGRAA